MFVKIGSFNILAPSWASPSYYPAHAHGHLFPSEKRIDRVIHFLLTHVRNADVLALQETEQDLERRISQLLADKYEFHSAYHDDTYWAKWITSDRAFRRNGVAIALKKGVFDHVTPVDLSLGTGNHALVLIAHHVALDQWFRIISVHFELDDIKIRKNEVEALSNYLRPGSSSNIYIDVVAGDFNSDIDSDEFLCYLMDHGFRDVHRVLDEASATHPEKLGDDVIDHILVRGNHVEPISASVHSGDIMDIHPERTEDHKDQRLARCLEFNGSDHFAIDATLFISSPATRRRTHSA
jgi:endonuclease/exonuclease/phosphatase family metal-dependent hydrolase